VTGHWCPWFNPKRSNGGHLQSLIKIARQPACIRERHDIGDELVRAYDDKRERARLIALMVKALLPKA
jgi:hypothetical protein